MDSTVADNHTLGTSGGVFAYGDTDLSIVRSTVSGNTAGGRGGGVVFAGEEAIIRNSTISGNVADEGGGGIYRDPVYDVGEGGEPTGPLHLEGSTIVGNRADADASGFGDGGGIASPTAGVVMRNTIVAGNSDGGAEAPDCAADVASEGHNLVESPAGCTLNGAATGDVLGVAAGLGPLQDNGGPTATHALLAGSPAIDAGSPTVPGTGGDACDSVDQRGVVRPQPARCDIGAYEVDAPLCPAPLAGCAPPSPRGSVLRMSRSAYGARRLGWIWNGTGIAATDFGVPLSATGYVLCLYDEAGGTPENVLAAVVPPGRCPGGPCWKDLGVGFKYRNEVASPAGIEALQLRAALDGTGRLRAKGKSAALALPALPLAQDPAVVLQLRRTDGPECWEARYTSPNRNDGATFSARSD